MSDPLTLHDRLMAVKPTGLSASAWTIRAGVSRMALNDIKRRGSANHATITKLLDAIGVTFGEFEAGVRQPEKEAPPAEARAPYLAFRGQDRPRDIPIVGTALCADIEVEDDGLLHSVEGMEMHLNDVIDYARRPLVLDGRRDIYALYFRGVSMAPRYEPGELAYVDPRRPPTTGEYVVAQLRAADGDEGERIFTVMAKRLVRQTAQYFEFEQFNPAGTFRVERARVAHLHRIIPWDELVTF
ncbi:S24 family peptidase [Sphingomonas gellani]|nr:S24 family peptidase [Sphingomonas gellani]